MSEKKYELHEVLLTPREDGTYDYGDAALLFLGGWLAKEFPAVDRFFQKVADSKEEEKETNNEQS